MGYTNFPQGITSFGVPIIGSGGGRTASGSIFGNTYFVDVNSGSNGNSGKEPSKAWETLTYAFTRISSWDTIMVAPGNYTGNYQTPLNADAAFVSLIGVQATDMGFGPWAGATTSTSPILEVKARGWRISGFEFDAPASSSAIKLTTSGTSNANYTQIDNNLITGGAGTGKYGIDWSGAPTYTKVLNNRFDGFGASGATALWCSDSSTDVPRMCRIHGNEFQENTSHIAMNPRGFKSSVISGNFFHLDGISRDATVLLDTRGGGGNQIVGNYFDITKAQYTDDSATAFIRTASTDAGMGNYCSDGAAADLISV